MKCENPKDVCLEEADTPVYWSATSDEGVSTDVLLGTLCKSCAMNLALRRIATEKP